MQASPASVFTAESLDAKRLSVIEVARRLDIHVSSVWRWINTGVRGVKLPTIRIGERRFVRETDLITFLNESNRSAA